MSAAFVAPLEREGNTSFVPTARFELFIGLTFLVIVGPNQYDWLKCSKPQWQPGRPGTPEERAVANRAIEILNKEHGQRVEDSRPAMIASWRKAAAELGFNPDTFLTE